MAAETPGTALSEDLAATLTLRRSRALLRGTEGRLLALTAGGVYLFAALLVGDMLVFGPTGQSDVTTYYLAHGVPWWGFPVWILVAPNAVLSLPLFAVVAMALVAAGIGLGMGVSVRLALQLARWNRRRATSPAAAGSITGLTPALLALLTLGACCSTTAATTASLGVVAQATGSSTDLLLENAWFLSIVQIAVLWVSLVAQERLVTVYAHLAGPSAGAAAEAVDGAPVRVPGRVLLARTLLAVAAVAAILSGVAELAGLGAPGRGEVALLGSGVLPAVAGGAALLFAAFPAGSVRGALGPLGAPIRAGAVALGAAVLVATPLAGGFVGGGALRWALEIVPVAVALVLLGVVPAGLSRATVRPAAAPWAPDAPPVTPRTGEGT